LLTDVLRKEWGFTGLVVSDYTSVNELIDHGLGDLEEVSARSINAGLDMDMVGEGFLTTLKASVAKGRVSEATITEACRKVLEAKYKLGLFEDPYRYCDSKRAEKEILHPSHLEKAREAATKSFVLLKNKDQLLPLAKKGTVALIGPLAATGANMPGTWSISADLENTPSLFEGMQAVLGDKVQLVHHLGTNLVSDPAYQARATLFGREIKRDPRAEEAIRAEALAVAAQADVIVAALGESSEMSGESSSRSDLNIPENQQRLLKALLETGKPVVLVLFTGRPLTLTWEDKHVPAILNVWFAGTETGKAVADVLFGDVVPAGKLPVTFPKHVGQVPIYYAHKNTGRPQQKEKWFEKFRSNYLDVDNEPLYPFGYGLSYTQFNYTDLKLDKDQLQAGQQIQVSLNIQNTGSYDGYEIVQMYIQDVVGSVTRPVKELKGFEKVYLKKGERKTVTFTITEEDLRFFNADLKFQSEPGTFQVFVGPNSRDTQSLRFVLN